MRFTEEELQSFMEDLVRSTLPNILIPTAGLGEFFQDELRSLGFEKEKNPNKVFRLNGRQSKLRVLKNQQLRKSYELLAEALGLSFDETISRIYDLLAEGMLNRYPVAIERYPLFANLKIWKTAYIHKHRADTKEAFFCVYRFNSGEKVRVSSKLTLFRCSPTRFEIRPTLPVNLHKAIFDKRSKLFKRSSRQRLFRWLYESFLTENGIPIRFPSYNDKKYYANVSQALDAIASKQIWAPYGWRSPPLSHSLRELDGKFFTYSRLNDESNREKVSGLSSNQYLSGSVIFTFDAGEGRKSISAKFDPIRDLLPYVCNRLWRDPSSIFALLLLQFVREHGLYDVSFDLVSKDFDTRLSQMIPIS